MHFAFIPYGNRKDVEYFLRDLEHKWFNLVMKKGNDQKIMTISAQVRQVPGGIYEYVFPREYMDMVLAALIKETERYPIPKLILRRIQKTLRLEPIPEYKTDKKLLCAALSPEIFVNIIPLGIRHDADIIGTKQSDNGWVHEAI